MSSFGTDGKTPVMLSEDAKYDDGVVQERMKISCQFLNNMSLVSCQIGHWSSMTKAKKFFFEKDFLDQRN